MNMMFKSLGLNLEGYYTIYEIEDGEIVGEQTAKNTITTDGKQVLYNFLTHRTSNFVEYLALGLINTASATTDKDLYHEIFRKKVDLAEPDVANSRVLYHMAMTPPEGVGIIEEIGAFTDVKLNPDLLISDFDVATDVWTTLVTDTTTYKEGENAAKSTFTTGTTTCSLTKNLNLSGYTSNDDVNLLIYPVSTANLTSIELRFNTDASNYYTITWTGATFTAATWNLKATPISSFGTSGTPDWSNVTSISLVVITTGSIVITFDSLRLDTFSDSILVSRAVVSPITKTSKKELLVVYRMGIS